MEPQTQLTQTLPTTTSVVVQKTNWGVSILFLLLGVLLGAGGFYAYGKFLVSQQEVQAILVPTPSPTLTQVPTPSPTLTQVSTLTPTLTLTTTQTASPTVKITPSTTPTPTLDPKVTWKAFTNTSLGYTIKYPVFSTFGRLICKDEANSLYLTKGMVSEPLTEDSCPRDGRYKIEIVAKAGAYIDNNQYYNTTSKSLTVGGVPAIKTTYTLKGTPEGPFSLWYVTIRFEKNNIFYEAYTGDKEYELLLEQMLTTFKFL